MKKGTGEWGMRQRKELESGGKDKEKNWRVADRTYDEKNWRARDRMKKIIGEQRIGRRKELESSG